MVFEYTEYSQEDEESRGVATSIDLCDNCCNPKDDSAMHPPSKWMWKSFWTAWMASNRITLEQTLCSRLARMGMAQTSASVQLLSQRPASPTRQHDAIHTRHPVDFTTPAPKRFQQTIPHDLQTTHCPSLTILPRTTATIADPIPGPTGPYLFYGSLRDPCMLVEILGLETEPELRPAYMEGFRSKLWGQDPPALVVDEVPGSRVEGAVYEVRTVNDAEKLAAYETRKYTTVSYDIGFLNGWEPARQVGSVFV